jgi:hypothetical protein
MAVAAPDLTALALLGQRVRPVSAATERVLTVPGALAGLLPHGGLQRGSLVATGGGAASTLALALVGPTTAAGGWVAVVGLPHLGLVAAAELGVDLERVLLVAEPGPARWAASVAALVDAVEVVLTCPPRPVAVGVQRRLLAQAREGGAVLVQVGGPTGRWATAPDLVVAATTTTWRGLGEGHGHLRGRLAQVAVTGRRGADRPRRAHLWLPSPTGGIAPVVAAGVGPAVEPAAGPVRAPLAPRLEEAG